MAGVRFEGIIHTRLFGSASSVPAIGGLRYSLRGNERSIAGHTGTDDCNSELHGRPVKAVEESNYDLLFNSCIAWVREGSLPALLVV